MRNGLVKLHGDADRVARSVHAVRNGGAYAAHARRSAVGCRAAACVGAARGGGRGLGAAVPAGQLEHLHAVVAVVGHGQSAVGEQRNALGVAELARIRAVRAKAERVRSVRVEHLHAVVATVGGDDAAVGRDRNSIVVQLPELAVGGAAALAAAERAVQRAVRMPDGYASVAAEHVRLPGGIGRNGVPPAAAAAAQPGLERAVPIIPVKAVHADCKDRPAAAAGRDVVRVPAVAAGGVGPRGDREGGGAVRAERLYAPVLVVCNVQAPVGRDGRAVRPVELAGAAADGPALDGVVAAARDQPRYAVEGVRHDVEALVRGRDRKAVRVPYGAVDRHDGLHGGAAQGRLGAGAGVVGDGEGAVKLPVARAVGPELEGKRAVGVEHLYAVVAVVGDRDHSRRGERDAGGLGELPPACSDGSKRMGERAVGVEHQNAVVNVVGDGDHSRPGNGHGRRAGKPRAARAVGPELEGKRAVGVEHLYAVVAVVGGRHHSRRGERDVGGAVKLPAVRAVRSKPVGRGAVGVEDPDAVAVEVGHCDLPGRAERDAGGAVKPPAVRAGRPNLQGERAVGVEQQGAVAAAVGHCDLPGRAERDAGGAGKPRAARAVGPELEGKRAVGVEHLDAAVAAVGHCNCARLGGRRGAGGGGSVGRRRVVDGSGGVRPDPNVRAVRERSRRSGRGQRKVGGVSGRVAN